MLIHSVRLVLSTEVMLFCILKPFTQDDKAGPGGPNSDPPPPWREESRVFPELSPGPEGPGVADISLEKKQPELPGVFKICRVLYLFDFI